MSDLLFILNEVHSTFESVAQYLSSVLEDPQPQSLTSPSRAPILCVCVCVCVCVCETFTLFPMSYTLFCVSRPFSLHDLVWIFSFVLFSKVFFSCDKPAVKYIC